MSAFLDVEDDEQRQKRLNTLLKRLNTTSSPSSSAAPSTLLNVGRECPPGPIKPPAELLARVQAFLPAISASNEALSQKNPQDVDIENVAEDERQYIEMNLGLGVFEAKRSPRSESRSPMSSDAESDVTSSEPGSNSDSSSSGSEEDSESDSDYSSSDDDSDAQSQSRSSVDMKVISSRPIKPLPRRVSQQSKLEV